MFHTSESIPEIAVWPFSSHHHGIQSLRTIRRVWGQSKRSNPSGKPDPADLQLVLVDLAAEADLRAAGTPLFGTEKVWRSFTPFVSTRHAKTYRDGRPKLDEDGWQIGSPKHDIRRLLSEAGLPLPGKIQCLPTSRPHPKTRPLQALQFQQIRPGSKSRSPAGKTGGFYRLTFPEPVTGPITLGYGAHFGLGLFVPVPESA